jgi:hypothetical protein
MELMLFVAADAAAHPRGSACGEDAVCALLSSTLRHCQQVCSHVPHQPVPSRKQNTPTVRNAALLQ